LIVDHLALVDANNKETGESQLAHNSRNLKLVQFDCWIGLDLEVVGRLVEAGSVDFSDCDWI